eukprot:1167844-Rhodomonas_salina.2
MGQTSGQPGGCVLWGGEGRGYRIHKFQSRTSRGRGLRAAKISLRLLLRRGLERRCEDRKGVRGGKEGRSGWLDRRQSYTSAGGRPRTLVDNIALQHPRSSLPILSPHCSESHTPPTHSPRSSQAVSTFWVRGFGPVRISDASRHRASVVELEAVRG